MMTELETDITERKQAEEALRESKELFEKIFLSQRDAIFLLDAQVPPAVVDCNPIAVEMFGYSRQEMLGRTTAFLHVDETTLRDFQQRVYPIIEEQGFVHVSDFRMKRKDGTVFSTDHTVAPLQGEQGTRVGWVSVVRNVTERRRAEEALRESEDRHRAMFEQAADSIVLVDAETGALVQFNDRAHQSLGYSREEFEGLKIPDFEVIQSAEDVAKHIEKIAKEGAETFETKHRAKSGEIRDIQVSSRAVTLDGRHFIQGIWRDVTERRRAEEALRESEDRHRAMFEQAADSIVLVDAETGALVQFNDRAHQSLGYSREEFEGLKIPNFEVIQSAEDVAKHLEKIVKEGAETFETKHRAKSGEIRDIQVSSRAVTLGGRHFIQGIWRDVTERRRAEEALRESEDRHRAMFEQAADSIVLVDAETGALVQFNDRAYEALGYTREEFAKLKVSDFEVIESPEEVAKHLEKVVKEGADTFETNHRTKGGEIRDIEVRSRGLSIQGKDFVQSIWRDITERKRAEEALRLYAERLRIVHEIDQAILAVQPLEAIARVALTQIERLLPCQWTGVVELEPERNAAKMVATRIGGKTRNDRGIRLLPEMFGDIGALRQGKVEVVEDVLALSARPAVIQAFGAEEVRSYVSVPLVSQGELFGCLCLGASRPAAFAPNHIEIAREVADELAIAIQSSWLSQQVRDTRRRLEALSHRLLEVQEAERRHMASELHDEIGQMLTGLGLLLEMGTRLPADAVRGKLEEAQGLVTELTERVRELSLGLRPAMLDDLGLLPALLWHFERYATQADVRVDFKHAGLQRRFGSEVETGAYRIVQEALTNVARHADVSEVVVRIWADRDTLSLQIEDEGAGFDPEAVLGARDTSGLAGMHERAALLGGQLIVESAPGAGTRLAAELPLRPQAEKRPKKR